VSNTEKDSEARVEILGQIVYYPRTVWGMLSVVGVLAGICVIVWIVTVKANPQNLERFLTIAQATSKKTDPIEGHYQVQFWTPSVKTKTAKEFKNWEVVDSEEKLNDFAEVFLEDQRVQGYRRYEVTGQGRGLRREGVWWVLTVEDSYEVTDLMEVYQKFWKNEGSIYIEVLRSGAGKHL
jgi:hypothetical protein